MQLEEFQDIDEKLVLKEVNALQEVQEIHKEVITNTVDHPSQQDVVDCIEISDRVKVQVEEVKQLYEDFKIKTIKYTTCS